jgi:hypothetical protein
VIVPLALGTLDAVSITAISSAGLWNAEFHAALVRGFQRGLCGFLISGSSWTEVQCLTGHIRFGSLADIGPVKCHVRFTPESGHGLASV